ncbi:MAG: hypothetical protein QOD70_1422, partial [Frankiales bacterium]|nr:hypothetical protein [Frankiales bacterium]
LPLAPVVEEDADEYWEEERRPYSLSLITLGMVVAIGLGVLGGVLASRAHNTSVDAQARNFPLVTPAAIAVVPPSPAPLTTDPTVSAPPRVTYLPPSQTPTPTASATPTTSASATTDPITPTVTIDPTSGPNDTEITVTGSNWTPNGFINLSYRSQIGTVGATGTVQADASGAFTTTLKAHDPQAIPGAHQVVVDDGTSTDSVTFTQT